MAEVPLVAEWLAVVAVTAVVSEVAVVAGEDSFIAPGVNTSPES